MAAFARVVSDLRLARLLRRAQAGDREAFRDLYRRLHPIVWGYVARRVPVAADAEDIVGRVFETLVRHLASIDPARGGPRAYAIGVARNAVIDHVRAQRPTVPLDAAAVPAAAADASVLRDADASILRDEELRAIAALIDGLPAQTREMFVLRFGDGLSCAEIGRLLDVGEAAVKQRFSRTLRQMRHSLTQGSPPEAFNHG